MRLIARRRIRWKDNIKVGDKNDMCVCVCVCVWGGRESSYGFWIKKSKKFCDQLTIESFSRMALLL